MITDITEVELKILLFQYQTIGPNYTYMIKFLVK